MPASDRTPKPPRPVPRSHGRATRSWLVAAAACLCLVPRPVGAEPLDGFAGPILSAAPAADAGPPLYIPDASAPQGFAGMPVAISDAEVRDWPRWFAGASGLVMTRSLPGGGGTWPGGVDLHLGRWFGPRQHHAVELLYWGVYDIAAVDQGPARTASRSDIVNDVEINWVYSLWDRPEFLPRERPINLMWLAGFRYFGLSDTVLVATTVPAGVPTVKDATNNNVFGGQIGAKFDWMFLPRVRLAVVPKFMIGGNGVSRTLTVTGLPLNERSTLGTFSWLGSVDTGLAWDVTDRWTLSLGYRVVGVGNIAQADGSWPGAGAGVAADSGTIVHGGFAGFEGRY